MPSTAATPIVLFGAKKGGVGKTTSCIATAMAYAMAGLRVGFRDCDSQNSLANAMHQSAFAGMNVVTALEGTDDSYDIILADSPPHLNEPLFLDEFDRCSLFVLVTGTGTLDLQPAAETLTKLRARRPDVPVRILINQFDGRRRLDRLVEEALHAVGLDTVPLIQPFMSKSEVYRHLVYGGWHVAAREVRDRETIERIQKETADVATAIYQALQSHS
ncbi:hypothetical protein AW736_26315 [Termitidicoccus mucosus]|uniref:CobQ/CobB/MinD/ParA nucleotide binding domain-containing protein n=1 Tax=Termitidicoccus mucosus TaxID=1184151 RepID=A0A178IQW7_9BACT|nr:hypothetical protein AW736_26315 [Opitutaceae bacterium TSB47]